MLHFFFLPPSWTNNNFVVLDYHSKNENLHLTCYFSHLSGIDASVFFLLQRCDWLRRHTKEHTHEQGSVRAATRGPSASQGKRPQGNPPYWYLTLDSSSQNRRPINSCCWRCPVWGILMLQPVRIQLPRICPRSTWKPWEMNISSRKHG